MGCLLGYGQAIFSLPLLRLHRAHLYTPFRRSIVSLFLRVSAIVAVLLGFTGAGFVAGEHIQATRQSAIAPQTIGDHAGEPLPADVTVGPPVGDKR